MAKKKKKFEYSGDDHTHKMTRGWLLPYLMELDILDVPELDFCGHGRWDYWMDACMHRRVPEGDIPRVQFTNHPRPEDERHVQDVLKVHVEKEGQWYDDAWLVFVRWLLHGFGRAGHQEELDRVKTDVRNIWYEMFDLSHLLRSPVDWSAYVLQGGLRAMGRTTPKWSKSTAFYSTPMDICWFMTEMLFTGDDREAAKIKTVLDPCVGTGSMLLPASNWSLRLFGQDIVYDLCLCTDLNGWLWMPWLSYMPDFMVELFTSLTTEGVSIASVVSHGDSLKLPPLSLRLETDPERVKATQDYREGKLAQGDFFDILGV